MKRNIIWMTLWVVSIAFVFAGMVAYQKSFDPQWWPAFLNDPGICLIWVGVIVNAIMNVFLSNTEET